jgi:multidrug efflux pump subunit AcrA (membrane-fusion protein)
MRAAAVDYLLMAVGLLVVVFAKPVMAADTSGEAAKAPPAMAIVGRASTACFSAGIRVDGLIAPRREAIVVPDQEGSAVTEVLAAEGDTVTAGQDLVRLKKPPGPPAPGAPADAIQTLTAPAAGLIISSTAVVGATASARPQPPMMQVRPLFRIAVGGEVEFVADVPGIHVPQLAPKQTARVTLEDGRDLNGHVRVVSADVDPRSQLARVRVTVEGDASVRVGTFAHATIDATRSCGVAVPRSAVRYQTAGTTIQVVNNDGVIETRHVHVGLVSDVEAEIRDGVSENELIVANAGTSLRDGDHVKPIFADEARRLGAQ